MMAEDWLTKRMDEVSGDLSDLKEAVAEVKLSSQSNAQTLRESVVPSLDKFLQRLDERDQELKQLKTLTDKALGGVMATRIIFAILFGFLTLALAALEVIHHV